ncbi:uncharacterized protein [Ptychodera flava]|uniref:uncharacterized protein n=1 Tax=Ptychodera flava TaxID=63121 RepID=UPI00396A0C6C
MNDVTAGKNGRLRFITYLAPSVPVEYFETVMQYLEEKLNKDAYLIYESRWSGPPLDRIDPFTRDEVDIGFLCSTAFMKLLRDKKAPVELLQAGPVYMHPRAQNRPVYFADLIVHADNKERFKEFVNLRGCKWVYNDPHSLSGCYAMLRTLKQMGENTSFFGHVLQSGSHLKSIKLILDQTVETAIIDSNCLAFQMKDNPEVARNIHVLTSFGPLPIYPIAVNARMPEHEKEQICSALLQMHTDVNWQKELNKHLVSKFVEVSLDNYKMEDDLRNAVSGVHLDDNIYY